MSDYASLTVAQLKEQLKTKGLATDGKKAELVQRLTDSDSAEVAEPEKAEEPVAEPQATGESAEAGEAAETGAAGESAEAVEAETAAEPAAEPVEAKPKTLSPEERKQLAVELLNKKIKRAEKFGDEALAQAARKDLARVEKFGVDAGTALAKEIGYLDRSINGELKTDKLRVSKKKKN